MSNQDIQVPNLSFTTLTEGTSTLSEAYQVCVQAQAIEGKVRGAMGNVFDIVRYTAVGIYRDFLSKASDDVSKINTQQLVGTFLHAMEEAEASFNVSDKPKTWNNYKSKLKLALEKGFNLHENSTVGFNAVTKFLKQISDAETAAADQAAMDAAVASGNVKKIPGESGSPSADNPAQSSANTDDNTSSSGDSGMSLNNLSPEMAERVKSLVNHLNETAGAADKSPIFLEKVENVVAQAESGISSAHAVALGALAGCELPPKYKKAS